MHGPLTFPFRTQVKQCVEACTKAKLLFHHDHAHAGCLLDAMWQVGSEGGFAKSVRYPFSAYAHAGSNSSGGGLHVARRKDCLGKETRADLCLDTALKSGFKNQYHLCILCNGER